jgi:hypothetical protein
LCGCGKKAGCGRGRRATVGEEVTSTEEATAGGEGGNVGRWRLRGRAVQSSSGCESREGEKLKQSRGGDKTLVGAVEGELGH